MAKIELEIKNCSECPHFKTANQWSTDGWDRMEDWICTKEDKKIQGSVEWNEESKIEVPEWCPIKVKENVNTDVRIDETMSIENGLAMYFTGDIKDANIVRTKTPKGRKVIYTGKNGYNSQHMNLPFEVGDELTVEDIYVDRNSSNVEFSEFPNKSFNTVMFKDVEK